MMLLPQNHPGRSARCNTTSIAIDVVDYEHDTNMGPTVDDFRVDAASGPYSKWNARAGDVFAGSFCVARYPEATGKSFTDALSEFRVLLPAVSTDIAISAGFEDLESYRRFFQPFSKNLRAYRKAESRLSAARRLSGSGKLVPIVRKLVEDGGMSCDEEDPDGGARIISPAWRSASATKLLKSLDTSPLRPRGSASGKTSVEPRTRETVGSRVPGSLPVNFYSPAYLLGLSEAQYTELDPQPAVDTDC